MYNKSSGGNYMRKFLFLIILILSVNLWAQETVIKIPKITIDKFSENLMKYFLNKNDQIIYETISVYENKSYTEMLDSIDNIVLIFYYGIKNDDLNRYNNFKEIITKRNTKRLINIFYTIDNMDISLFLEQQEPSPELNDFYWTLYFSSGNLNYINYLLNIAKKYYNETVNINNYLVARSAIWSLSSNATKYGQIKDYIINNNIINNEIKNYILNTNHNKMQNDTVEFIKQQREKGIW